MSELLSSDVGPAASPSRPAMLLPADKAADTASRIAGNTVGKVTRGEVSLRERYDPTALLAAAIRASRGCVQLLL